MSEGAKREKEERPVKDERRNATGESTAGATSAPLGVERMRQSGVEPPHSKEAEASLK